MQHIYKMLNMVCFGHIVHNVLKSGTEKQVIDILTKHQNINNNLHKI